MPPKQALALSLALHELATNAAKYGALSRPEGRVELRWEVANGQLNLSWRETGGPKVAPRSRRGFGSRLLDDVLSRDLDGQTRLEFAPDGVCCWITAPLSRSSDADIAPANASRLDSTKASVDSLSGHV
jgi:two-component sensor histidine kinase